MTPHPHVRRRAFVALSGTLLLGVGSAAADDPVTVTVPGSSVQGFHTSTSTDDARREVFDVAGLVDSAPGVHVRRLGGADSFATLSIRGAASNAVGVFLAGIPLTGAADPSLDLSTLPLFPGAEVRVLRSFAPATMGTAGYLGGLLVLSPPTLAKGSRTETWVAGGSFGALKMRVSDVSAADHLHFASAVNASRADGDFTYFDDDPSLASPVFRTRQNNGHVSVAGIERVDLETPWGGAGVTVLAQARRQELAGVARYPTRFSRLDSSRLAVATDASLRTGDPDGADPSGVGAFRAAAYAMREGSEYSDPLGEIDPTRAGLSSNDAITTVGGSVSWRGFAAFGLLVDFVVDGRHESSTSTGTQGLAAGGPAQRSTLGGGADAEVSLGNHVTVAATARADQRWDASEDASTVSELAPTGHLGIEWAPDPAFVLAAHVGKLARPASFLERFGDRGVLLGNSALVPESAETVDAGVRGHGGGKRFRWAYEVTSFGTLANNLIAFVPYGSSSLRAENLAEAHMLGLETTGVIASGPVTTTVSYTALASENEGDDALARGKPLPGRPAHDLTTDLTCVVGSATLRYGLDVTAGTTLDPKGTIVLPMRVLHGAGAWWDVPGARGLRFGVDVQNLLDLRVGYVASPATGQPVAEPISDLLGFPLPGRTVWVSARYLSP